MTTKMYTDINQSKKLAEILPLESADMYYFTIVRDYPYSQGKIKTIAKIMDGSFSSDYDIPCWSLAALISILPRFIEFKGDKYYLRFMKEYVEYANDEISITGRYLHTTGNNNLLDACYEMIIKLHEQELL